MRERYGLSVVGLLLMLSAACVPGCLRGKVEIVVQRDGSGTIRQEFTLAEHAVVALDESPVLPGEEKPAITEQAIREALESTVTIEQVEIKDLPDGSRHVQWSGRINDIMGFLLSDAGVQFCGLSLERNGENRIALRCNVYRKRGHVPQGSINWLYGIAKGMHYETTVTFPGTLVETDGQVDPERPNTVTWVVDLRDREGFERLKALDEKSDGIGTAVFADAKLTFEIPAKLGGPRRAETSPATAGSEEHGVKIALTEVRSSRCRRLEKKHSSTVCENSLEIGVALTPVQGDKEVAYYGPFLTHLEDNLGHSLLRKEDERGPRRDSLSPGTLRCNMHLQALAPAPGAEYLKNLRGHLTVVTDQQVETILIEDIQALAGQQTMGHPVLDTLKMQVRKIRGSELTLHLPAGEAPILSIRLFDRSGSEIEDDRSRSTSGREYTYRFRGSLENARRCEIRIVTSEQTVDVPFAMDRIDLP